jgi:23S rRNA (cytidine1920-2'-O)/16S rRNA (cytidine1409-2'-O)-methyltransferase
VSFISLKIILPPLLSLLERPAQIVALIKPQFEAGRDKVGKSGVVRDPKVHEEVLKNILTYADGLGFRLKGLTFSPITGGEGNIEFLALWTLDQDAEHSDAKGIDMSLIESIVQEASHTFTGNSSKG